MNQQDEVSLDEHTVPLHEILMRIDELVQQTPDLHNPQITFGTCAYYKEYPRPNEAQRCIIGAVAHSFGWRAPSSTNTSSANSVAHDLDWPVSKNTAWMLRKIQQVFDRIDTRINTPIVWKDAWADAVHELEQDAPFMNV